MKRSRLLFSLAALTYLVAWFVPVIKGGTTLQQGGIPGWEALRYALSPMWDWSMGIVWWKAGLSVLSGLTNGWFLLSAAGLMRRPVSDGVLFGGLLLAVLVDLQWLLLAESVGDLRIGYYLWTASFLLLAGALTQRSPARSLPFAFPRST